MTGHVAGGYRRIKAMDKPVMIVVDEDTAQLRVVEQELSKR